LFQVIITPPYRLALGLLLARSAASVINFLKKRCAASLDSLKLLFASSLGLFQFFKRFFFIMFEMWLFSVSAFQSFFIMFEMWLFVLELGSSGSRSSRCSSLGIDALNILVNRFTETERGRVRGMSVQTIGVG
jgi:hypothetical protein